MNFQEISECAGMEECSFKLDEVGTYLARVVAEGRGMHDFTFIVEPNVAEIEESLAQNDWWLEPNGIYFDEDGDEFEIESGVDNQGNAGMRGLMYNVLISGNEFLGESDRGDILYGEIADDLSTIHYVREYNGEIGFDRILTRK